MARLECSLQPDGLEGTATGMRQEVDIRYVVTSLEGAGQHLYEDICQRGQMENLLEFHERQLSSDRMSCHSATANQVRLVLHTAAFWLMHGVRAAIPQTSPLAKAEFATIRERLIKIGARVIEHIARIRVQLPTSYPQAALFRAIATSTYAVRSMSREAGRPDAPPTKADQPQTRCTAKALTRSPATILALVGSILE